MHIKGGSNDGRVFEEVEEEEEEEEEDKGGKILVACMVAIGLRYVDGRRQIEHVVVRGGFSL